MNPDLLNGATSAVPVTRDLQDTAKPPRSRRARLATPSKDDKSLGQAGDVSDVSVVSVASSLRGETTKHASAVGPDSAVRASGEGLSIRPQTLHITPLYRRLRDSILRPHLRLTESRYFWERWKSRLGPDATVLIMEVRDRCNRALGGLGSLGVSGDSGTAGRDGTVAPQGQSELPGDGCTVSASELAAACGFSRVTLWRLLQREDVRQFIQVEHNYVYDRRIGKKRRTVNTYHVLMEDPLVEEDAPRLQQLLEAHALGEIPTVQFETKVVDSSPPMFHSETTRSGSNPKPQNVEETIVNKRSDENAPALSPLPVNERSAKSTARGSRSIGGGPARLGALLASDSVLGQALSQPSPTQRAQRHSGSQETPPAPWQSTAQRRLLSPMQSSRGAEAMTAVPELPEVDVWRKYPEFAHYVEEAETLLGDRHSRGFYITALKRLYPRYMDLWQRALTLAREQQRIRRSRGALFTRLLRTFAEEAGVEL
jgi:hypothetical protein